MTGNSIRSLIRLTAGIIAILAGWLVLSVPASAAEIPADIVSTDHQKYSYDEMREDVQQLCAKYPGLLTSSCVGQSVQGREILQLTLGNAAAPHRVMIQASMHAREYMTSQLVMEIVEYICSNYDRKQIHDVPYTTLLSDTCFVILPMVNPDGVMISQQGAAAAVRPNTVEWLNSIVRTGGNLKQFKANSNGVDLNQNFAQGFGGSAYKHPDPWIEFFCGFSPASEPETQALISCARSQGFAAHINYHTSGNIIYYSDVMANEATHARSKTLMDTIRSYTGYKGIRKDQASGGSGCFADFVTAEFQRPTVTVEIGTANPVPIGQFAGIFKKNRETWGAVAYQLYTGAL
ncbi:MAG: hypothetical protein K6G16_10075 [Lachnospiraceae bacterium]|nr:hypothetical protein [Lachnospiraceae bacterium]